MRHRTLLTLLPIALIFGAPVYVGAQTYAATADLLFYGDNTEFANPFRAGETLLGAAGELALEARLNDTVTLRGGIYGKGRFGARRFLEHAEPALALEVSRGVSRFIFGSLRTAALGSGVNGPDLETLHGLLPPVQDERLVFQRGQEMGLQWRVDGSRFVQDTWINWQRLNTAEQRERLDAGYRADFGLGRGLRLHGQWHVVHDGGQQFAAGAVSDSQAVALGLQWTPPAVSTAVILDAHVVATQDVVDRERPELSDTGVGVFSRAAVARGGWRAHVIVWRGRDTRKSEGDANYLAWRRDGSQFRGVRDYGEAGLTREFRPAPGVHLFAAVRIHRSESHYEYSYRIVARTRLRHLF